MCVLGRSVREVERAVAQQDSPPETPHFTKALCIILHLLFLLEKLEGAPEQEHQKRQTVYRLLKLNPRARTGYTPLHMAVDKDTTSVGRYPVGRFPSLSVASLLLECGADVDSRDCENNTPLHIAAANGCTDIMALLVRAGAHFDATNARRKTAYDLLDEQSSGLHPLNYVTLQCLAARAIESHRLPYKGLISEEMEAFIELHWLHDVSAIFQESRCSFSSRVCYDQSINARSRIKRLFLGEDFGANASRTRGVKWVRS